MGALKDTVFRTIDAAAAALLPGGARLMPVLARVEGYLYPHEAVFLYWLARSGPGDGVVVEIGSYKGLSTLCMARGLAARGGGGRIVSIDPHLHGTEREFRRNLERFGVAARVDVIVEPSSEAAGRLARARAVFIDGDHAEASADADFRAWLPHIEPGGFIAMHDSTELGLAPGPLAVARRVMTEGAAFDRVGTIGTITWGRRRGGRRDWTPPHHGKRLMDLVLRCMRATGLNPRSDAGTRAYGRPL